MKFSLSASALLLLGSSLVGAAPTIEKRYVATFGAVKQALLVEDTPNTASGSVTNGEVSRKSGSHDISTLVEIDITATYAGHKCQLEFLNPTAATGSKTAQVFLVGDDPTNGNDFNPNTVTWANRGGAHRGAQKGTFTAVVGGVATWSERDGGATFPCPVAGTKQFYEVAPEGTDDFISWTASNTEGLVVAVL